MNGRDCCSRSSTPRPTGRRATSRNAAYSAAWTASSSLKTHGGLRLFWYAGRVIVCTHGTVKKSQKTSLGGSDAPGSGAGVIWKPRNCTELYPMKKKIVEKPAEAAPETFAEMFAEARERLAYHVEGIILAFTEEVARHQQEAGVSNSQLARKLGVSPAFVTKLLGGENNFTIETMVKVARALDCRLCVCLEPAGMQTEWMHFLKEKPKSARPMAAVPKWSEKEFRPVRRQETFAQKYDKFAFAA